MAVSRKVGIEFVVDGTSSVERAFSTVSSSATRSAEVVASASSKQTEAVVAGRVKQIEALRASAAAFSEASGSYVKGSDEQIAASKLAADAQRKLQVALGETAAVSEKTGGSFASFAGRVEASGKRLRSVGKNLTTHVTLPIVALGAVMAHSAIQAQEQTDQLDKAFANQGESVKKLTPKVNALEAANRRLGFTNSDTRASLERFTQAGEPFAKAQRNIALAMGLARDKGVSLATATGSLIKLQAGNTRSLKEYGIVLPATTKNVDALKAQYAKLSPAQQLATAATEKHKEALAKIQDKLAVAAQGSRILAARTKGLAKTFADSAAGGVDKLKAQLSGLAETAGTILIPIVTKVIEFIGKLADKFQGLSPTAQKAILIFAGLAAAVGPVVSVIGTLVATIGALAALSGTAAIILGIAAAVGALVVAFVAAVKFPDQMKAALERMGLSAKQSGEVVHRLQVIFEVVRSAGEQLVAAIRAHWSTIRAVIKGAWLYISATVRNGLQVVRGVLNVIGGLLTGDWSRVWKGIEQVVGGALKQIWTTIRLEGSLLAKAAAAAGQAMWNGLKAGGEAVVQWIVGKFDWILNKLNAIKSGISGAINGATGGIAGKVGHIAGSIIPHFATGVTNFSGGWATVGERGPETMFVPKGASIIPHGASGNMSSLGMLQAVIPVYLNGRVISRETRREALRSANRGNDWSRRTLA